MLCPPPPPPTLPGARAGKVPGRQHHRQQEKQHLPQHASSMVWGAGCGVVGLWGCGVVGLWGCGVVGLWGCGVVGLWGCGVVGLWCRGVAGSWGRGAVGSGLYSKDFKEETVVETRSASCPNRLRVEPLVVQGGQVSDCHASGVVDVCRVLGSSGALRSVSNVLCVSHIRLLSGRPVKGREARIPPGPTLRPATRNAQMHKSQNRKVHQTKS